MTQYCGLREWGGRRWLTLPHCWPLTLLIIISTTSCVSTSQHHSLNQQIDQQSLELPAFNHQNNKVLPNDQVLRDFSDWLEFIKNISGWSHDMFHDQNSGVWCSETTDTTGHILKLHMFCSSFSLQYSLSSTLILWKYNSWLHTLRQFN